MAFQLQKTEEDDEAVVLCVPGSFNIEDIGGEEARGAGVQAQVWVICFGCGQHDALSREPVAAAHVTVSTVPPSQNSPQTRIWRPSI